MKKIRLALNKGEELRFLSHLDFAQAVERTIRRANIQMAYSEGFNPHMKISFSSALALGITANPEYLDMDIVEEASVEDIMVRFNAACPPGLQALAGKEKPERVKKMMAICNYATYQVTGPVVIDGVPAVADTGQVNEEVAKAAQLIDWEEMLSDFNGRTEIEYEKVTPKKTRMIDVKHFVKTPITAQAHENGTVTLTMNIGIYPEGTMKPSEVWNFGPTAFSWTITDGYEIHRSNIQVENETGIHSPLDVE